VWAAATAKEEEWVAAVPLVATYLSAVCSVGPGENITRREHWRDVPLVATYLSAVCSVGRRERENSESVRNG
jgi:hypothetical protein